MYSTFQIRRILWTLAVALAGSFMLPGCSSLRNEVDPSQLGLASPKLVVSCFLSPQDTTLAVKVTRSNTVVGDSVSLLQTGNTIRDATVTLSEGGRSVRLVYNHLNPDSDSTEQTFYSVSARLLPILTGRTYTLTVTTANGQRATSTCTIPAPIDPTQIKFDSLTESARNQPRRYYVLVRWQDPAGQANTYQVAGIFRYTANGSNVREEKFNSLSFDDDNRGLFTDMGVDGTMMESGRAYLTSSTANNSQPTSFYSQYNTASVTVSLLSVDQSYYRYQEAIIRQRRSRNNPFAEPVLIPSNIEGGLGCFAGYNNATLTLKLK